VSLGTDR